MIKKLEKVCEAFHLKCLELCRNPKTGESTPLANKDVVIFKFQNESYYMLKDDVKVVSEIMKVVLEGNKYD